MQAGRIRDPAWQFREAVKLSLTDCLSSLYWGCSLSALPCRRLRRSHSPFVVGSHSARSLFLHRKSSPAVELAEIVGHPFDCAISVSSERSPFWPPGSSETEPPVPSRYNTLNTQHAFLSTKAFRNGLIFSLSVLCFLVSTNKPFFGNSGSSNTYSFIIII